LAEVVIMAEAYTHSTWQVKPGLEDEFVRRWEDLARWSALQGLSSRAKLLRDVDEPSRVVSFGPWESMESVRRWRAAPGFHERVARLQEVLDDFERTLKVVSER
jgi:heme-degrading monooxygenase HmoA